MSARRYCLISLGASLLSLVNSLIRDAAVCSNDVPGGCCSAVPLVEGPCTFVAEGDLLGCAASVGSAASVPAMSASSCAAASPGGAFPLAARNRLLTVVFQPCKVQNSIYYYTESANIELVLSSGKTYHIQVIIQDDQV